MERENDLTRLREWLATYPGYDLRGNMMVDWLDKIPGSKSLRPGGLVEVSRAEDILGNVTISNQYNFGLYIAVEKAPGDGEGAAYACGGCRRCSFQGHFCEMQRAWLWSRV